MKPTPAVYDHLAERILSIREAVAREALNRGGTTEEITAEVERAVAMSLASEHASHVADEATKDMLLGISEMLSEAAFPLGSAKLCTCDLGTHLASDHDVDLKAEAEATRMFPAETLPQDDVHVCELGMHKASDHGELGPSVADEAARHANGASVCSRCPCELCHACVHWSGSLGGSYACSDCMTMPCGPHCCKEDEG